MKALKELLKGFSEKINCNVFSLYEKQRDAVKRHAERKAVAGGNGGINNFMLSPCRFCFAPRFRSCGGSGFAVAQGIRR